MFRNVPGCSMFRALSTALLWNNNISKVRSRKVQIIYRRALLLSPMYQITVISVKYMWEFVFIANSWILPKKAYFHPCIFLVLQMKTSINSADSVPAVQFDHLIAKGKQDLPTGAFTVRTLHGILWWPLTSGNEVENRPVLYPKVSCCFCNVFTVIIINLKIPRKCRHIRCSKIDSTLIAWIKWSVTGDAQIFWQVA